MAKRDWVDYVNLGSNLLQNSRLGTIRDELKSMASTAVMEQMQAAHEDRLREFVFQAETELGDLKRKVQEEPAGVLALAIWGLSTLQRGDVTTAGFRSFEDKDRLRTVLDGFNAVIRNCSAMLSEVDRTEARLCAQYLEDPNVEATAPEELLQQLSAAKAEVARLKSCSKYRGVEYDALFRPLYLPLLGVALSILIAGFLAISCDLRNTMNFGAGFGLAFCGILLAVSGLNLIVRMGPTSIVVIRDILSQCDFQSRQMRKVAIQAAQELPIKEVEVKRLQSLVDEELKQTRIVLERERDALLMKVMKITKTNSL